MPQENNPANIPGNNDNNPENGNQNNFQPIEQNTNPFTPNPNPQPEISRREFIPPLNPPASNTTAQSQENPLDFGGNNDLFAKYFNIIKHHPGKSLYIGALTLALLFTFLPWIGTFLTNNSYNFYYFAGRNIFCLLYILGIFILLGIRSITWFNLKAFDPYKKIIDFVETALIGALVMFVLTLGIYGDIQFGLILSVICILGALSYISYLKIFKQK